MSTKTKNCAIHRIEIYIWWKSMSALRRTGTRFISLYISLVLSDLLRVFTAPTKSDHCPIWLSARIAFITILTVTQGSIGLPMILWEEHSQTKRKVVTFHMVTFLCEPSGKDIVKKPHEYLSEVIEFLKSLHPRTDEHLFLLSIYFL